MLDRIDHYHTPSTQCFHYHNYSKRPNRPTHPVKVKVPASLPHVAQKRKSKTNLARQLYGKGSWEECNRPTAASPRYLAVGVVPRLTGMYTCATRLFTCVARCAGWGAAADDWGFICKVEACCTKRHTQWRQICALYPMLHISHKHSNRSYVYDVCWVVC